MTARLFGLACAYALLCTAAALSQTTTEKLPDGGIKTTTESVTTAHGDTTKEVKTTEKSADRVQTTTTKVTKDATGKTVKDVTTKSDVDLRTNKTTDVTTTIEYDALGQKTVTIHEEARRHGETTKTDEIIKYDAANNMQSGTRTVETTSGRGKPYTTYEKAEIHPLLKKTRWIEVDKDGNALKSGSKFVLPRRTQTEAGARPRHTTVRRARKQTNAQLIAGYAREIQARLGLMESRYGYNNQTMTRACVRQSVPAFAREHFCDGKGLYLSWSSAQQFYKSHLDALDQVRTALTWRALSPSEMAYYERGMGVWRMTERVIEAGFQQQVAESVARYKLLAKVHDADLERRAAALGDAYAAALARLTQAQSEQSAYERAHFKGDFLTAGRFVAFIGVAAYRTSRPVAHVPVPLPLKKMPERP
ncbi:MAG: hypothetical protein NVS1B14_02740 [Vulcanimicrobiaceae bacterium]